MPSKPKPNKGGRKPAKKPAVSLSAGPTGLARRVEQKPAEERKPAGKKLRGPKKRK